MWFGMSLVIVSYIMVNVAYLTLLTPLEISSSKAVGVVCSKLMTNYFLRYGSLKAQLNQNKVKSLKN